MQKSTQHTFSSPAMKKSKRNGLFRHHEPVKCVIEPLKWRWFALCGKSINNDLIDNDKIWINLLEDRNATSHLYSEQIANEIAHRIVTDYVEVIGKLIEKLDELI